MKRTLLFSFFTFFFISLASAQYIAQNIQQDPLALSEIRVNAKVYPNPASDYIWLKEEKGVSRIVIFNVVGKKLKDFDVRENDRYFIADLTKGMYLVQLITENGKIVKTQRLNKR